MEIGKVYRGLLSGPWCEPEPNQCHKVVARSSKQEWVDCCVAFSGGRLRDHFEMLTEINGPWYYYEIQTD